jgi:orotidine-5'-phosphate decarboxylase
VAGVTATPIVALDVADAAAALALVDRLGDRCRFYKIGSELFTASGPSVVRAVRDRGCEVFLDLKLHDIPNTVRGAVRSAASIGASLVTVHAAGGRAMLEAAVEGAGARCRVLGVTVLTSMDSLSLGAAWGRSRVEVRGEVLRLAGEVAASSAYGVVCSGEELEGIRARYGEALRCLVPGIRLPGDDVHDQRRVVTPREAAERGATYLVLGRTVTSAADPVGAMDRVLAELRS